MVGKRGGSEGATPPCDLGLGRFTQDRPLKATATKLWTLRIKYDVGGD